MLLRGSTTIVQVPVFSTGAPWLRRAIVVSVVLHALAGVIGWQVIGHSAAEVSEVDIELAPPPPLPEALPAEVRKEQQEEQKPLPGSADDMASTAPKQEEGNGIVDAGVDARADAAIDARPDAAIDARPDAAIDAPPDAAAVVVEPDAAPDAAAVAVAVPDADAVAVAVADAAAVAAPDAGSEVVAASGSGSGSAAEPGSGSGSGTGSAAGSGSGSVAGSGSGSGSGSEPVIASVGAGSGSGVAGIEDLPAVDGAATTPGTAANLLAYFPAGHSVTALIRFDRLRTTEWAVPTERLLRPMPDYLILFGERAAKIADKFDTLVISSPRPRDPAATTLVGRTAMGRAPLRDFLGAQTKVTWSAAKGGLLGKRGKTRLPNDQRVFLSPFRGWFLLAQPADVPDLTAPAPGDLDTVEATAKLPAWLAGIRKIEDESGGDKAGPALVVTLGFDGKKISLGDNDFGLGIPAVQTPLRISLAMEVVKQGWIVRGNMKFATEADATAFLDEAKQVQARVDSRFFKLLLGDAAARVIKNLAFARTGARLSYTTSMSIKDTRALLDVAAGYLDTYFRGAARH